MATGLPPARLAQAQHGNADVAGLVWEHLDRVSGWVVVVDNLDFPADAAPAGEPLREYRGWVRPSVGGLLVVTSRDRHHDTWGPAAVRIPLDPLSDAEGASVLCDAAPQAGTAEQAAALSARLGGLPLALRAAGAVLAEPTSRYNPSPTPATPSPISPGHWTPQADREASSACAKPYSPPRNAPSAPTIPPPWAAATTSPSP